MATSSSMYRGTGTTACPPPSDPAATASRQRACRANPRSIDSMELPSGRGPARLAMCPRASRWNRRPSREAERLDPVRRGVPLHHGRVAGQLRHGDLPGEVTGVHQDHVVLEQPQVARGDHGLGPGDGDHHVRGPERLLAARDGEAVEAGFQPGHRVDLDHRHGRAGVPEVGRHALPARAVAEHRDPPAVGHLVGDPQVRLEHALPDRVPVLRELLDRAVVDDQDRDAQPGGQRAQPHPPRGRLLGPAQHSRVRRGQVPHEQVPAVVQQQLRPGGHHLAQVRVVHGLIGGGRADHLDPPGAQVLDRVRLGAGQVAGGHHPRAALGQRQQQGHGLGLQVDPGADGQPVERPGPGELGRDGAEQPAAAAHPLDP